MAYGIQVLNDSGTIQLDENYPNLKLVTHTTGTISPPFNYFDENYNHGYANADTSGAVGASPIVAFKAANLPMLQTSSSTARIYDSSGSANFEYFVFDAINNYTPPSGEFGMAVFNSAGNLTYHSSYKYMKVATIVSGSNYQSGVATQTLDSGKSYAVMCMRPGGRLVVSTFPGGGFTSDYYGLFATVNNNVISFAERLYYSSYYSPGNGKPPSATPGTYTQLQYAYAILDVTGL